MSLATRRREQIASPPQPAARRTAPDVLFASVVILLVAVHLVIFVAVVVRAPVIPAEQRSVDLLGVPDLVARIAVLPFHALLLTSLFILGNRIAGRWAGFGAMLALLALDLAADPARPVYGPPTAVGGWIAASLLAAALVLLGRRPLAAAALVGAASGGTAALALALPAFLVALAIRPARRGTKARELLAFTGVWAAFAAAAQLVWLARLGVDGWLGRAGELFAEFQPHTLVPWLEQARLLFAAWHFPAPVTFVLAMVLFLVAGIGFARYLVTPVPGESGPAALRIARRVPVELWAAVLVLAIEDVWWGWSGSTVIIDPNVAALAAIAPLLTPMAYRGAKWLLTVNRFWALAAVVYLTGLILARSTQLVLTLIAALTR